MEFFADPQILVSLLTLTALEIVLGIDNVIFISILAGKLPVAQQDKARKLGLSLALITRIILLCSISWVMSLTQVLFVMPVMNLDVTGKSLILLAGGLFLIGKSVMEIHEKLEGADGQVTGGGGRASFRGTIIQILLLDIVFSLDSVITAVGMVSHVPVMIAAIVVAVLVMMAAAGTISDFIDKHPSLKMLALSFLVVVGTVLIAESFDVHVPKGYVYFAMAFSLAVEAVNIKMRTAIAKKKKQQDPVKLRKDIPGQ
jgi:predicted tellurium resistance membrane protein TerC